MSVFNTHPSEKNSELWNYASSKILFDVVLFLYALLEYVDLITTKTIFHPEFELKTHWKISVKLEIFDRKYMPYLSKFVQKKTIVCPPLIIYSVVTQFFFSFFYRFQMLSRIIHFYKLNLMMSRTTCYTWCVYTKKNNNFIYMFLGSVKFY